MFQELTRQYLREWGANWLKDAPQRLVYYDRFQSDLFPEKRKIVFLTQILPTEDTVGYEQLSNLVVRKLNGREILSLDDFAEAAKNRPAVTTRSNSKKIRMRSILTPSRWKRMAPSCKRPIQSRRCGTCESTDPRFVRTSDN